jgi:hypothetical protein
MVSLDIGMDVNQLRFGCQPRAARKAKVLN